jgi:hypothetical protein
MRAAMMLMSPIWKAETPVNIAARRTCGPSWRGAAGSSGRCGNAPAIAPVSRLPERAEPSEGAYSGNWPMLRWSSRLRTCGGLCRSRYDPRGRSAPTKVRK